MKSVTELDPSRHHSDPLPTLPSRSLRRTSLLPPHPPLQSPSLLSLSQPTLTLLPRRRSQARSSPNPLQPHAPPQSLNSRASERRSIRSAPRTRCSRSRWRRARRLVGARARRARTPVLRRKAFREVRFCEGVFFGEARGTDDGLQLRSESRLLRGLGSSSRRETTSLTTLRIRISAAKLCEEERGRECWLRGGGALFFVLRYALAGFLSAAGWTSSLGGITSRRGEPLVRRGIGLLLLRAGSPLLCSNPFPFLRTLAGEDVPSIWSASPSLYA